MTTTSIRPAKLADAIAEHFKRLILDGTLQPGERLLPERELSAKLDVSRPSLRDGMARLVELGLLMTDAQGVAHVSTRIGHTLRDPLVMLMDDPQARIDCIESGWSWSRRRQVTRRNVRDRPQADDQTFRGDNGRTHALRR